MKKFGIAGILAALGVKLSTAPITNRDVVPPASDFSHDANAERPRPKKKDGGRAANRRSVPFRHSEGVFINRLKGWRHERQQTGITARQQRIKKQTGKPQDKILSRIMLGVVNNQRPGRMQSRFVNRFMVGYGPGCAKHTMTITEV